MTENKLIIASAGSGKTTHVIEQAMKIREDRVLITTYTEANELEIRKKFGVIPKNITTQTWFSFLLEHGVRPYQSYILEEKVSGMLLVNSPSGIKSRNGKYPVYFGEEDDPRRHYLTNDGQIYSDKISKFVFMSNKKSGGLVFQRLSQIYKYIFIDEVQDLAGYDLELIKLLMKENINVCLVGDPRQVTYLTHHPRKYPKYTEGKIKEFITNELPKKTRCEIDEKTLVVSHRNNQKICDFSSKLYPNLMPSHSCKCDVCVRIREVKNAGIFFVSPDDIESYLTEKHAIQLRWDVRVNTSLSTKSLNIGNSKGLGFDHVLIYLTKAMHAWLLDNEAKLSPVARAKLYVAITRARHSVAFVTVYRSTEYENFTPQQPKLK
jgi:DNA helicase-2/ATP-dependent DNA helicase PcrA